MADTAKYTPINGGKTLITDLKTHFSFLKTKRSVTCAYGFMFVFICVTIFLAFSPSPNSSSPWFTNVFSLSSSSNEGDSSYRSHFNSVYSYFFPNNTSQVQNYSDATSGFHFPRSQNTTFELSNGSSAGEKSKGFDDKGEILKDPVNVVASNSSSGEKIEPKSKDFDDKMYSYGVNNDSSSVKIEPQSKAFDDKNGILKDPMKPYVNVSASKASNGVNKDSSSVKIEPQSKGVDDKDENLKPSVDVTVSNSSSGEKIEPKSKDFDDKNGILKDPMKSNVSVSASKSNKESSSVKIEPQSKDFDGKVGDLKANQSKISPQSVNQTASSAPKSSKEIAEKGVKSNFTSSLVKNQSSGTNKSVSAVKKDEDVVKSLLNCDFFDGDWVKDESYPLYKPGSCSLIDEQFNCFLNGRPDNTYIKMKWKPKSCTLPRLNGTHMLELLRGKRLAFVGDSLNRNMWESLVCILRNLVKDQKKVYEEFGRHHFRTEASYSFIFEEYNIRVEFFASPFLVQEWEVADKNGAKKETLRLDLLGQSSDKYKNADILVFNTGHWWTHEKTSLGKDYYQEGSHVYSELDVNEAFRKALTTWGRWVDSNVNPKKTFVLFRGYSASHFSGGQWNSGGACDHETEPIKNTTYLTPYPSKMMVLERVLRGMKTQVSYLNVTRMTDFRKDGHPSIYRKQKLSAEERKSPLMFQDCSHWCLPGVPDSWNELLYAKILVNHYLKQQEKQKQT